LCFGFSQITRNTPRLLTILHFSQIFLTEERTFTIITPQSAGSIRATPKRRLRYFVL
jgi:hypothetical protein